MNLRYLVSFFALKNKVRNIIELYIKHVHERVMKM